MRCAHSLVGLELAKFYTLSGDTTKRTMFLVKALKLFEQDNWKLLIVQTNLELVKCFKKIGNVDQYVLFYFNQFTTVLIFFYYSTMQIKQLFF